MDTLAYWFSGGAVLLSVAPRLSSITGWILQCEACAKLRHALGALWG